MDGPGGPSSSASIEEGGQTQNQLTFVEICHYDDFAQVGRVTLGQT